MIDFLDYVYETLEQLKDSLETNFSPSELGIIETQVKSINQVINEIQTKLDDIQGNSYKLI